MDRVLARIYRLESRSLNENIKRNAYRFPDDLMFELTKDKNQTLRSHFATLRRFQHSKYLHFAFTKHGMDMRERKT